MRRALVTVALVALPMGAWAHGFEPGHLALVERRDGRVEARWRPPSGGEGVSDGGARVRLPRCRALPGASAERATYNCGAAGVGGAAVAGAVTIWALDAGENRQRIELTFP